MWDKDTEAQRVSLPTVTHIASVRMLSQFTAHPAHAGAVSANKTFVAFVQVEFTVTQGMRCLTWHVELSLVLRIEAREYWTSTQGQALC